jgi:UDP-glucose 4-epimerase
MSKRILITGATGFIGSTLYNHLVELGYELFVIDNLSFGNKDFIKINDSNFFLQDILEENRILNIFHEIQPQWVIHLAAIHFIPYCNEFPMFSSNTNIIGTRNVLRACEKVKSVEKVFFASTAAVYPISDFAYLETHDTYPMDIYGLSKIAGEHLCQEFFLRTGKPTIICRFFNAFGPNETNPHLIPVIQEQINAGLRTIKLGNLEPKRDFIHTSDMAKAVQLLLEKFDTGIDIFNLGRGLEYSVIDIVEAFENVLGEKIKVEVDSLRVRKVERMHLLADISKISSFTGWAPKISIIEGIRTLVANK